MSQSDDRVLALAGVFQALFLVKKIAHEGRYNEETLLPCMYSLFQIDASSTTAVYGSIHDLHLGLETLYVHFGGESEGQVRETEIIRYALGIFALSRQLHQDTGMQERLYNGLMSMPPTVGSDNQFLDSNVIERLAELYQQTISTLNFRIHVQGSKQYLQNPESVNLIRALLLSAVRSAYLWRQNGGTRWQLFFKRRQILLSSHHHLTWIKSHPQK